MEKLMADDRGNSIVIATSSGKLYQQQVSSGRGDTIAKITAATGLNKLAKGYTRVTGRDCGCGRRQKNQNQKHPYTGQQSLVNRVFKAIDEKLS